MASALALSIACALVPAMAHGGQVPAGFEALAMGQSEQIAVRMFGRSAGLWPVHISLDSVRVEQPNDVLRALGFDADAQAALSASLGSRLPRNSHLACRKGVAEAGCGYLAPVDDPHQVQVILDEAEGVLDIFVDPQWLPDIASGDRRFHQMHPDAESVLLHQHMLNASGGSEGRNLTVQGSTVLGMPGRSHIAADWSHSSYSTRNGRSQSRFDVDNFYYRHDFGSASYMQAGRMDRRTLSSTDGGTFNFAMLPLERVLGMRVGSSRAYRVDATDADSTPVTVLLARPARVDLLDGERLLETQYLSAGVNTLNTRQLPSGAYLLTLRIYEDNVLTRTEHASFSKGAGWTQGEPEWFIQAGRLDARRGVPYQRNVGVGQVGARLPLGRMAGLTMGAAQVNNVSFNEARLDLRQAWGRHAVRASVAEMRSGRGGVRGSEQQLDYRNLVGVTLLRQQRRGEACNSGTANHLESLGCNDSFSASASVPWAGGAFQLGYTDRTTYRPSLLRDPVAGQAWLPPTGGEDGHRQRTWQASFSRGWSASGYSFSLSGGGWRQRSAGVDSADHGVYATLSIASLRRDNAGSRSSRLSAGIRASRSDARESSLALAETRLQQTTYGTRELSASVSQRDGGERGASAGVQLNSASSNLSGTVSWQQGRHGNRHAYGLTQSSSVGASRHGLHWGGAGVVGGTGAAGVLLKVDKADGLGLSGSAADVDVYGQSRQRLSFGERRLLPLIGYREQRVELSDASEGNAAVLVKVANAGALPPFFLPPGKVLTVPVHLQLTYTYVGNAVDVQGRSLEGAQVLNAASAPLSNDGGFAIELPTRADALFLLMERQLLRCPMQVLERRSAALLVGDVQCAELHTSELPADIENLVHVQRLLRDRGLPTLAQSAATGPSQ
ncbi:TPA: TcfC E-set like domain-containing protein [Stenotrophomonas maltophilia]